MFDYGLLIGQDGFSLTRDMTVDVLVTFPHRSLQEFLGAFYFVLSLAKKQTVHCMGKAVDQFLKNRYSRNFVSVFDESNGFLNVIESSVACEVLSSCVSEPVNCVKVDFKELMTTYPVLSLALADHNEIA